MKWFVFMFAAIAATLMVTPEANSGSFDPVTGAYTTDPITVTLTPKTVAASTSVIANGERFTGPLVHMPNYQARFTGDRIPTPWIAPLLLQQQPPV